MPVTGVYFIPAHPNASTALGNITERLRSSFPDEDLIQLGRWTLEQKLMRDTPGLLPTSSGPNQRPSKPRYMQFLSLSHYHNHGFIYTSEPTEKPFHPHNAASPSPAATPATPGLQGAGAGAGVGAGAGAATTGSVNDSTTSNISPMLMTTVPHSSYSTLFQHFTYACQPFWCHRLTVVVQNGVFYDIGDFRVRLGDVRQTYPTNRVRGAVVEIEWRGPSVIDSLDGAVTSDVNGETDSGVDVSLSALEESDVDAEFAATALLIREFWVRVGVEGAREAILVPGVGSEVKERLVKIKGAKNTGGGLSGPTEDDPNPQAGTDVARQYMEVLRFNR
ncbi:Mediator complex subunit Med20 [Penicillium cosmopolitanum]|uniref:Mediator of RNA polymerase II transcription subunit 20 n=1 Tax=Penicillium cosmopolitanum TaxID=1131564 RepID=A0A9X0B4V6_9EURO|nr:Mediator complex subunit Med20 [Penicillium cosmopolitanum]KAJ5388175.1 Mediator complex subunit Med20 [Penicillium cosmopolitanum]